MRNRRNRPMPSDDRAFQAPFGNQAPPANLAPFTYPASFANQAPLPAAAPNVGLPNVAFPPPTPLAPSALQSGAWWGEEAFSPTMLRPTLSQVRPTSRPEPPPTMSAWCCQLCSGTLFHHLQNCNTFLAADVQTRLSILRDNGHWYTCFERNHRAQDCNADVQCAVCNKRHHTLLHKEASVNSAVPQAGGNLTA